MYRDNVDINYTVSEIISFKDVLNKAIDTLKSAESDAYSIHDKAVSCLDEYISQCERYLEINSGEEQDAYSLLNTAQSRLIDARNALKEIECQLKDLRDKRASAPQESQSSYDGPIRTAERQYDECERWVHSIDNGISNLYRIIDGIHSERNRLSDNISKYNSLKGDVESALSNVVFAINDAISMLENDIKRTDKAIKLARDINAEVAEITNRAVHDDCRITFNSVSAVSSCAEDLMCASTDIASEIRQVESSKQFYASQVTDNIMRAVDEKLDEFNEIQREIAVQWQKIAGKLSNLADALEKYYNV